MDGISGSAGSVLFVGFVGSVDALADHKIYHCLTSLIEMPGLPSAPFSTYKVGPDHSLAGILSESVLEFATAAIQ